jgi:hypothetical protein
VKKGKRSMNIKNNTHRDATDDGESESTRSLQFRVIVVLFPLSPHLFLSLGLGRRKGREKRESADSAHRNGRVDNDETPPQPLHMCHVPHLCSVSVVGAVILAHGV